MKKNMMEQETNMIMCATSFYGFAVECFVFASFAYYSNLSICYEYRPK